MNAGTWREFIKPWRQYTKTEKKERERLGLVWSTKNRKVNGWIVFFD